MPTRASGPAPIIKARGITLLVAEVWTGMMSINLLPRINTFTVPDGIVDFPTEIDVSRGLKVTPCVTSHRQNVAL
jgi:hypothetical protein